MKLANLKYDVPAVASQFRIHGGFLCAEPYGSGHINDTFCVTFDRDGSQARYIFQRINHNVFKDPATLMENIERVTEHLGKKMAGQRDEYRSRLTLARTHDGKTFHCDAEGNHWRAYPFIEKALTYDAVESTQQAFEAAKAFGHFQQLLADLPAPPLHETIVDFHHTPKRLAALERAIEADVANRAKLAKPEIEFALKHKAITSTLLDAELPERVTHNDTKLNNVMFDDSTGEGICVIDLDTVMPGIALYDFGDMVRTTTSPAKEDERDLSKVEMQFPMFEALARGYLLTTSGFLTKMEKQHLAFSGRLITFEIGIRFLADFLAGDAYFKVHRDQHNLDRCRTQFRLMESMAQQESRMNKLVETI